MIDRVKLREVAQKFVDENFTWPEPADVFFIENAMLVGINLYMEMQKNEQKKESE
jgi:hypothetical protein